MAQTGSNKTFYATTDVWNDASAKAEAQGVSLSSVINSLLAQWTYGNTDLTASVKLEQIRKVLELDPISELEELVNRKRAILNRALNQEK